VGSSLYDVCFQTDPVYVICSVLLDINIVVYNFCISTSSNPFLRCISLPISDFVRFPSSRNFWIKKLMSENCDMTLSRRGQEHEDTQNLK